MSAPSSPAAQRRNPAHAGYFADPFVFRHGGVYYAIGTEPSTGADRAFPTLVSEDFWNWTPAEAALIKPHGLGDDFWAPEVACRDGAFFLYYSVGHGDKGQHLRVAVADTPLGPYRDTGDPLLSLRTCPFSIDAHPFQDADGRWYLFYARDFLDSERPGTALVVVPQDDPLKLAPDFAVVARAHHDWQRFLADRPLYGGVYDWHTLEGPFVVRDGARYHCLYSGGNWQNATYGLDYVTASHVLGPYVDDNPGDGARVLRTVPGRVLGPGHNSVVMGPDDRQHYLAYHAWDADLTARRFHLDVLDLTPEGPRGRGPTWESQPL